MGLVGFTGKTHPFIVNLAGKPSTGRFQCRGIPRRSGSQGVLGVIGVLRFFPLFAGVCPFLRAFCGNLRAFPVSRRLRQFAGVCVQNRVNAEND